jgi:hypothetical protein
LSSTSPERVAGAAHPCKYAMLGAAFINEKPSRTRGLSAYLDFGLFVDDESDFMIARIDNDYVAAGDDVAVAIKSGDALDNVTREHE